MSLSNNGPKDAENYSDDLFRINEMLAGWVAREVNAENAGALSVDIDTVAKIKSAADGDRKAIKQPFLESGRRVDAEFRPVIDGLDEVHRTLKELLSKHLRAVRAAEARAAEELRRKEAEIQAQARAAAEKAAVSEFERTALEEEAARASTQTISAERRATNAGSIKVAGHRAKSLRKSYRAKITDIDQALAHFRPHPRIRETIEALANEASKASRGTANIPGVEMIIHETL